MKHKIAFIRDSLEIAGGAERVFLNLANRLSTVCDVYLVNRYKNQSAYPVGKNCRMFYLNDKKRRVRYSLIDDVIRLRSFLKKEKIDAAVSSGRTCAILLPLACIGIKTKAVMSEQGSVYGLATGRVNRSWIHNGILDFCLYHLFDETILLTEGEIPLYKKRYPRVKSVDAIYNCIDDDLLAEAPFYDINARKIITVGRIDYSKGYEYLIEAAKKVLARHSDWQWDIYGEGEAGYKKEIATKIHESGLAGRLVLKGNSDHIYDLYNDYGIYVMTSRYEGLPMVLLEAKAKKLPLVSFDIQSGPSDIIMDNVNGYLIPPFDVDAMAEKICYLIEHPEVRQDFSDHAWDNIDKFRKENVVSQWVELIDGLVGESDSAPV